MRVLLLLFLVLLGCDEEDNGAKGSAVAELYTMPSGAALSLQGESAVAVNSQINIESLQVPIRAILLNGDGITGQIYTCDGSSDEECLVELSDDSLANLIDSAAVEIDAGTYTSLSIQTCFSSSYTGRITASGTLDGGNGSTTYYTKAGQSALSSEGPATSATLYFSGCTRNYPLPNPVTIDEGSSVSVKLYFDMTHIAFFGDGSIGNSGQASYSGGSSFPYDPSQTPSEPFVAAGYLDVAGTVDDAMPTVTRFLVQANYGGSIAQGVIGLFYNSDGEYFGGYSRAYYDSNSSHAGNWFVTPLQTFSDNGDGTYTISNYGGSATGSGYFNASDFVAESAENLSFTDADGNTYTYSIIAIE